MSAPTKTAAAWAQPVAHRRKRARRDARRPPAAAVRSQLLVLVRPTVRSTDWLAPIAGAVLAVAVEVSAGRLWPQPSLELAAVALALGASFALDDDAAASIATTPTRLALRHGLRAACAMPLPAAVWLAIVMASPAADADTPTLELASLSATALAVAAARLRAGNAGGLAAAPAVLGVAAAAPLVPTTVSVDLVWALVLAAAAAVSAAACLDPAVRTIRLRGS